MQRLVAIGLGLGDVVVKLLHDGLELLVHPAQGRVAVLHRGHHHAQRADVKHLVKVERLAAHLLDDAVDVLRAPLHAGADAARAQIGLQPPTQLLHVHLALAPLFVEQAGHFLVGIGLQEAKGQVLQLPLDLPDAQAVGQRRKHLQRLARQAGRYGALAGRMKAQRLQARGQAQHHHTQVAREGEQHLAHVLGLHGGVFQVLCGAGLLLHAHELGGLYRQRGKVGTKGLGDHLFRLVQMNACMHQIAGGLHGLRTTNALEDGSHGIGVGQRVFAGIQRFASHQGLGKRARTRQRVHLLRQGVCGSGNELGDSVGLGSVGRLCGRVGFHPATTPSAESKKPVTAAT